MPENSGTRSQGTDTGTAATRGDGETRRADNAPLTYGSGTANAGDTMGIPASDDQETKQKAMGEEKTSDSGALEPSGTDATGGASDTTTDYVGGEIRGG